jgi:hypothetical protein
VGEGFLGLASTLTESTQLSMQGHFHQVGLEEKKLWIAWQVLCEPPPKKWSASTTRGGPEAAPRKSPDYTVGVYAVDVYLTE